MVFGCCVLVYWIADALSIKYCDSGSVFCPFFSHLAPYCVTYSTARLAVSYIS